MQVPCECATEWRCAGRVIDLARTRVMGVVNVTPDSFSDGGAHDTTEAAVAWGARLLDEGADILDVGGESTRPGFAPVDDDEECRRVLPVIERLAAMGAVVSVDTRHAGVARRALEAGAAIVNRRVGLHRSRHGRGRSPAATAGACACTRVTTWPAGRRARRRRAPRRAGATCRARG